MMHKFAVKLLEKRREQSRNTFHLLDRDPCLQSIYWHVPYHGLFVCLFFCISNRGRKWMTSRCCYECWRCIFRCPSSGLCSISRSDIKIISLCALTFDIIPLVFIGIYQLSLFKRHNLISLSCENSLETIEKTVFVFVHFFFGRLELEMRSVVCKRLTFENHCFHCSVDQLLVLISLNS